MNTKLTKNLSISDLLNQLSSGVVLLNTNVKLVSNRHHNKLVPPKWMSEIGIGWLFWLLNAPQKLWKK
ncbi:MAG: hypothetical protein QNJ47_08050 [Nostocaceae cyanobacterium]|nr:hypothetical protein [Nostocaceae cyanobacterium]